jgi:hypothetical protein
MRAQASSPRISLAFDPKMIMFWQRLNINPVPKGEVIMALNICWLDDLAKAKEVARQTKKPVLLDFFNPQ